ncbi:MAG: ATP-binding cassette domain-containing protein [Chloroflexi bacterium]|nr:MAG: ATP-binding cassette domain-containing protein [Chloroflexota bacterium]
MTSRPAIELDRVAFSYGKTAALRDVSLVLQPGELAYLVGPSGAGKTTLLKLAHGQLRPASGSVVVCGVRVHRARRRAIRTLRRRVSVVFEDYRLVSRLTALENVVYALRIADLSLPPGAARRCAAAALASVGLGGRLGAYPRELSGGQRQRVALARALASRPRALLADEPVANLDRGVATRVLGLLEHVADEGTAVLIATVHSGLARRPGRILHLREGTIDDQSPDALPWLSIVS